MNDTMTIFDYLYPKYKITKPIRLIELDNLEIIVTDKGNIFTTNKNKIRSNGRKDNRKGKLLKPVTDKDGYLRITLTNNNKRKSYYVHRLVARTYLDNYDEKLQVNHKNGIKTDNRVENLEWCTTAYNNAYGTKGKRSGDKLRGKLRYTKNNRKVAQYDSNDNIIETYKSIMTVAKKLNVDGTHIVDVCKGRRKTAYGYKWRYIDE